MSEREVRPFQLLYADEPWKMLVGCVCCARTKGNRVRDLLPHVFLLWPTADELADADPDALAEILRPLGFQNRRAVAVKTLCMAISDGKDLSELPYIGDYGRDSHRIFVERDLNCVPDDEVLQAYVVQERRKRVCQLAR